MRDDSCLKTIRDSQTMTCPTMSLCRRIQIGDGRGPCQKYSSPLFSRIAIFDYFCFFFGLPMRWFEITNAVLCSGEVRNVTVWQLNGERNAISIVRGLTRKSHFFCNLLYVTGYEKFILSQVVKRKCTKINF